MKNFLIFALGLALFAVGSHAAYAAEAPEILTGAVTGVVTDSSGKSYLEGWACAEGTTTPLTINVYADQPYPLGTQLQVDASVADRASDNQVHAACGIVASHNFYIQIFSESVFKQGGQPLFVYALSPTGQAPLLLAGSGSTLIPAYNPAPANPRICALSDGDPHHCLTSMADYDILSFESNFTCSSTASCCPGGQALIQLNNGLNNKIVEGNGFTLKRDSGQRNCPVIQIVGSNEVLIDNLNLDENFTAMPCDVHDAMNNKCSNTIQIQADTNVKLNKVNIYYGKGYVVSVVKTNGFAFANSAISEAGIIGLYVGLSGDHNHSSNVAITDSVIARSRTNGIALQGVKADNPNDPILITRNILTQNHRHGLWPAGGSYPSWAKTEGGELLLAVGKNIRVADNIIADAYCQNCYSAETNANSGGAVSAIEIGQSAAEGVNGLVIDHNYFYNGAQTFAIYQNPGTELGAVDITENRVAGWPNLTNIAIDGSTSGTISNNVVGDTTPSLSQNGAASYQVLREANNVHWEAKQPGELAGSTIEGIFGLSPAPRPGAPATPIFRCFKSDDPTDDYLTYDKNCNGAGNLFSVVGYSYEERHIQAQPFYECNKNGADDQFISWSAACEGQTPLGLLGYAQVDYSANP